MPRHEQCEKCRLWLVASPCDFLAIHERVRENKSALGRRLIEVDGYTFRVFVTNRHGEGAELWRDYNQQADGCCMRDFHATESAFLAVCFTFKLLSRYQKTCALHRRSCRRSRLG